MRRTTSLVPLTLLIASGLVPACSNADGSSGSEDTSGEIPHEHLGTFFRMIDTDSHTTQDLFNRGLRQQYAFDHAGAIRSYREALAYDGNCAMCWWGIALAAGPDITVAIDSASAVEAREAIRRARNLAVLGPASERALIDALARRLDVDPTAARAPLDSAYANAMEIVAESFPNDADAQALYGASLMILGPRAHQAFGASSEAGRSESAEARDSFERALRLEPDHPGACHYSMHLPETEWPESTVACAARLPGGQFPTSC